MKALKYLNWGRAIIVIRALKNSVTVFYITKIMGLKWTDW